jgi:pantoate--beta-alanine ligase
VQIIRTVSELNNQIQQIIHNKRSVGFVPTMGALHEGHASLVKKAISENDVVVASVFVNPTQFNNPSDLENYPRTESSDIDILNKLNCDYVFIPSVSEIYNEDEKKPELDLGMLDTVMEGEFRPGHFKGVVQVVHRLFSIVKPTRAYFGMKDFQQVAVIKHMVKELRIPVEIIPCNTLREPSGLAMSSRNLRLSPQQREDALFIYKSLELAQSLKKELKPNEVKAKLVDFYQNSPLTLEYVEIVDGNTLKSLSDTWSGYTVVCVVAYAGEIRLIDNVILK